MMKKEKITELLGMLLDFRFLIPTFFLVVSLTGNLFQCGKDQVLKHWLKRTKNALELAVAKNKSVEAKKALAEYRAIQSTTNKIIKDNDKKLITLNQKVKAKEEDIKKIKKRVGNMDLAEVINELRKELGEHAVKEDENEKNDRD